MNKFQILIDLSIAAVMVLTAQNFFLQISIQIHTINHSIHTQ